MSWMIFVIFRLLLLVLVSAESEFKAQCDSPRSSLANSIPRREAESVLFQKSRVASLISKDVVAVSGEIRHAGYAGNEANRTKYFVRSNFEALDSALGRLRALVSPEGRQFRFGKVSITVLCTMWLAIMMLAVYTALAVMRNSQELMESKKPPMIAEALEIAVRAAPHASVLCMLFVACRMYILASTDGNGDPPTWARACMVLATIGLSTQVFLATILPALVVEREDLSLADLAGDHVAGHIRLPVKGFRGDSQWYCALVLQTVACLGIYGGSAGVIASVVTFGDPLKVSPAIVAVILLVIVFLLNQAHVALAAAYSASGVAPLGVRAASARARKAPMIGVFFLAVRMRNLQIDPPAGMPPQWVWMSYYVVVAALILEMVASVCCRGDDVGDAESEPVGENSAAVKMIASFESHHYSPTLLVRRVQQLSFFVMFIGLALVYMSVMASIGKKRLSAEMKAVLRLTCLFFGVHVLQWIASFFSRDGKLGDLIKGTALSAGVCVSLSPLLSVLYVACRMRALQLSDQNGSPQWWAQESFHLGVMALMIQVGCCVMLPIFTGAATSVDGDGNPEYDLRPLFGAYAVQSLKYLALICLYGSVVAVCAAIALMDESLVEETVSVRSATLASHVLVALIACTGAGILSSAKVVGFVVKWTIEGLDEHLLGVNIWVGKAALSLCRGYVFVSDLTVDNPQGHHFTSPALLKVGKVVLKLNMWRLAATRGQEIEITALVLTNVEVNYEKDLLHGSNVGAILKFLQGDQSSQEAVASAPTAPAIVETKSVPEKKDNEVCSQQPEVELHLLLVKDISANLYISQTGKLLSVNLGDIEERNFQEHYKGQNHVLVQDICAEVLKTILKTVTANSHRLTHHAAEMVEAAVERGYRKAESTFRRLCSLLPCGGAESRRRQSPSSVSGAEAVLNRTK